MFKITIIFLALIKCEADILPSFFKLYAKDNFLFFILKSRTWNYPQGKIRMFPYLGQCNFVPKDFCPQTTCLAIFLQFRKVCNANIFSSNISV